MVAKRGPAARVAEAKDAHGNLRSTAQLSGKLGPARSFAANRVDETDFYRDLTDL